MAGSATDSKWKKKDFRVDIPHRARCRTHIRCGTISRGLEKKSRWISTYLSTLMYDGAIKRYWKKEVTTQPISNTLPSSVKLVRHNSLICQGSRAISELIIYSPYVASKDITIFLKILFPNTALAVISPSAWTSSIPFTAKKTDRT